MDFSVCRAEVCIPAQGILQRTDHILDDTDFILVAIFQQQRNILFKLHFCHDDIVTEKIITGDRQCICNADNRVQANAGGAGFNVTQMCRRDVNEFGKALLR